MANVYLEIDASNLTSELERLKSVMKPEQFDRCMYRIFSRTGRHVRKVLKADLPRQYHIRPGEVSSAVKSARVHGGALSTGCTIPVVAPRRSIGKPGFSAAGGAHGWRSVRRKYRVTSAIVKAGRSTLPQNMSSYGGQPPFRNLSAPKLNRLTFTREGKERLPIRKVEGIAIPQMPMNRSEADVQEDIRTFMEERMRHEFENLIAGR